MKQQSWIPLAACTLLGIGIGMYGGNVGAGTLIGTGIGLLASFLLKKK